VITLRVAGLSSPKTVIWKRAFKNGIGIDYDLDSDLQAQQSAPFIERDEFGKVKGAYFQNEKMKRKFIAAAKKKGRRVDVVDRADYQIPIPDLNFQLTTGLELRRLAMKMAVATAKYVREEPDVLDPTGREILLGNIHEDSRTLRDVEVHAGIEELRSPLDHIAYVEASASNGRCYGVVQLYGLLQLHLILNDGCYLVPEFAAVGILKPTQGYKEDFKIVSPLGLKRPSSHYFAEAAARDWGRKFQAERESAFGKRVNFDVKSVPSIRTTVLSSGGTSERTVWLIPKRGDTREEH
jgi:hypothetical protein